MINIEELQAENQRLREELLRMKREVLETAAVESALHDHDVKELAIRLFAVWHMDAESVENAYRKIMSAHKMLKDFLPPIMGGEI